MQNERDGIFSNCQLRMRVYKTS